MRSLIGPGRRALARHLARLGDTLETFGLKLREAVASAVGETMSGVVRETVHAMLTDDGTLPTSIPPPPRRSHSLWARPDDEEDDPWFGDPDHYPAEEDEDPPSRRTQPTSNPSRLPRAVAVGINTTLRWLRRGLGRYPVLIAVAVGLLTALATYVGGPLAAAVVGLAGSAFNLMSLAEVVQTGADALAVFGNT
jgi:hypothetical protein